MNRLGILLTALTAITVGCSHPGTYWKNRGLDFADCFTVEAGWGAGADIAVSATDWFATGIGLSGGDKLGFSGRHWVGPGGCEDHLELHMGIGSAYIAVNKRQRVAEGEPDHLWPINAGSVFGFNAARVEYLDEIVGGGEPRRLVDSFAADLSATVMPLSARVGFSFGQFADLVLGFFGLDIAGDDAAAVPEPALQKD